MTLNPTLEIAVTRLKIADVTLKRITASLADGFFPEMEDVSTLAIQTAQPKCISISSFEPASKLISTRRCIFEMFAALRMLKPSETYDNLTNDEINNLQCANVECIFLVSYDEELDESDTDFLDEECLSQFGEHNVPFNMWPYWREVVQSACSRMGLPKVILPSHRLKRSATGEVRSAVVLLRDPE